MQLNSLDIVVLIKIHTLRGEAWSQTSLARDLLVAQSQIHAALVRAPDAALRDVQLYEMLALVDAIREGRAREVLLATEMLEQRLRSGEGEFLNATMTACAASRRCCGNFVHERCSLARRS